MEAAGNFIALISEAGGDAGVTKAQAAIMAEFNLSTGIMYPLRLSPERKGSVQLCLAYLRSWTPFADDAARQQLYDRLVAIVGPLSTPTLTGYPGFDARKLNEPAIRTALVTFLREL